MTLQVFKCCVCIWIGIFSETMLAQTQKVVFSRDFSPAEGLVTPQEKPYRDEVCLNGLWDLQCVAVPSSWKKGSGIVFWNSMLRVMGIAIYGAYFNSHDAKNKKHDLLMGPCRLESGKVIPEQVLRTIIKENMIEKW